jgi:hypothetical protein
MFLIYIILSIILALIVLMYFIAVRIRFVFDTREQNMNLTLYWLYPFIRAQIFMKDKKPMLRVFLFGLKIYDKAVKSKKPLRRMPFKRIKLDNINVTAYYGFSDKFTVGVVSAALSFLSHYVKVFQNPDFLTFEDYIYLEAQGDVKIIPALISLAQ